MKKIWTRETLNVLSDDELSDFVGEICDYKLHYTEEQENELFDDILTTCDGSLDRAEAIEFILKYKD